jgi:P-type Mg2+ transporter
MNKLFSLKKEDLFKRLKSSEAGLDEKEAANRLETFGLNEISNQDKRGIFSLFLSQLKSPLVIILILSCIIAGFLKEIMNASIILGIVLINTLLGFYQEYKSEKVLSELKKYLVFKVKVFRDKKLIRLNAEEVVPGDIIFLRAGDIVPADTYVLDSKNLLINESVVSGESYPVHKISWNESLKENKLEKNTHILFMGTNVVQGFCKGIVISTGKNTEFGKTAFLLSAKEPPTDFQKNMKNFGNFLIRIITLLTVFVFAVNAFFHKGLLASFLFALALAVGITPELLPIIITVTLSFGAIHMAKKKVVVKKLISIEDLGNMNVLCMDKTGTLTENKIFLESYFNLEGKRDNEILKLALLCNSANNENSSATDPIDIAINDYAMDKVDIKDYNRIQEIELDYNRRRMSLVVEKNKNRFLICKGAPESIIDVCTMIEKEGKKIRIDRHRELLNKKFCDLSKKGFRVIAIAYKRIETKKEYTKNDEKELVFKGFITFFDPPKKTVKNSLSELKNLGVSLVILTGDNELVTRKVCEDIGLKIKNRIILGSELENLEEKKFNDIVKQSNVFARITPEQKFKIVETLKKQDNVVGFLGDGINDAPALKVADIGISVDSAVDIAKDSADIILLHKSLEVIVDGVKEGRKIFGNIIKYILNTISANFGNMFTLAISSLFLKFIPMLPSQILLANLISDGPLMTISSDNVDENYLHRPKKWDTKFISKFMIVFGSISIVFDLVTISILMFLVNANENLFKTAWFLESVLSEIIITFAIRTNKSFWKSKPSKLLVYASLVGIILTFIVIYSPLSSLFQFESLPFVIVFFIAVILVTYFALAELTKKIFFRKYEY